MIKSEHWLACLDLTEMDDILIGYLSFLTSKIEPKTITFLHIIESTDAGLEIFEEFPEIESKEQFEEIIRNELNERIGKKFKNSSIEIRLVLKEGPPTNQIIDVVNGLEPDLLIMGKKVGYTGEGVIPKQILKYVPTSILFVPENTRYNLKNALVPIDFSEQSAKGLQTAVELVENGGTVTAQHIYKYRAQFFPYILSDKDKAKFDEEIRAKKEKFIKEYKISSDVKIVLTKEGERRIEDYVYAQSISDQADIIVVGSKAKKLPGLIRHDFTDKIVNYAFGVPVLIQKNKERYQQFLKSIFS